MDLLIQTAGSLVAILALAGLAWWLKLGGVPSVDNDDAVRQAARDVDDGFDAVATAFVSGGQAALARDAAGRIIVIKCHGNRFAGRLLGPRSAARVTGAMLEIETGDTRFGKVFLNHPDASTWAAAINRVSSTNDA